MALTVLCPVCRKDFDIKERAVTRQDLEYKTGEYFNKTCPECCVTSEFHVNDVIATTSKKGPLVILTMGILIMVGVTVFFLGRGYLTILGIVVGIVFMSYGFVAVRGQNDFNRYRTTRTRQPIAENSNRKDISN